MQTPPQVRGRFLLPCPWSVIPPPSISFQYEGCFRRMRESILRPSFPPSPFVQGEGCFSAKTAYQTDATSWPPGSGRASSVLAQPVVDLSFRLGLVVAIPLLQDTRKFFGLATPVSYTHLRAHETR